MPRADKLKRWEVAETLAILKFLNDNSDIWYENHLNACTKAIEAANINRDAKSVYNKVHNMIKIVDEYDKTKKKTPNDPIWDNKKILNLLRGINRKTKEKKNQKTKKAKSTTNTTTNASATQMMDVDTPIQPAKIKETVDAKLNEFHNLSEQVRKSRVELKELEAQVSQHRSELKEKEEKLTSLENLFMNLSQ